MVEMNSIYYHLGREARIVSRITNELEILGATMATMDRILSAYCCDEVNAFKSFVDSKMERLIHELDVHGTELSEIIDDYKRRTAGNPSKVVDH